MRRMRATSTSTAQVADPDVSSVPVRPLSPRCGRVMNAYEGVWGPLLDDVTCGRPHGHNGTCRSVQAIAAERLRDAAPSRAAAHNRLRQERRARERLAAVIQAASEQARSRALGR